MDEKIMMNNENSNDSDEFDNFYKNKPSVDFDDINFQTQNNIKDNLRLDQKENFEKNNEIKNHKTNSDNHNHNVSRIDKENNSHKEIKNYNHDNSTKEIHKNENIKIKNSHENSKKKNSDSHAEKIIICSFSALFIFLGTIFIIFSSKINPKYDDFLISFSFSMAAALLLFYFLSSVAQVKKGSYKIGGAGAGFLIFMYIFFSMVGQASPIENSFYELSDVHPDLEAKMGIFLQSYNNAIKGDDIIKSKFAEGKMNIIFNNMKEIGVGSYHIHGSEVYPYFEMILDNVENNYNVVQMARARDFWENPWSERYYQKNLEVMQRGVKVTRIFVLGGEDNYDKQIIEEVIENNVKDGINARFIMIDSYLGEKEDLTGMIIGDEKVVGLVDFAKDGGFSAYEFYFSKEKVTETNLLFNKLLSQSFSYDEWKEKYYDDWNNKSI